MTGEFARSWKVVLGGLLGIAAGVSSLYFYSLGVFLKPLAEAYGWSRGEASLGPLVGTMCAALMAMPMGWLVDHIGSRRVAIGSLALLAAGLAALGVFTQGLASFLLLTAILSLLTAGSSPLPFTRLIVAAFDRSRGLAVGIALAGTGVGAILAPAVLTPLVADLGWRAGYLALAAIVALACLPVAFLLRTGEPALAAASRPFSVAILGERACIAIGLPIFLASAAILGTVVHFVPMLTDAGLSPGQAGANAALIGLSAIVGRLLVGALLDRVAPHLAVIAVFLIAAAGTLLLALIGVAAALPGAVIVGLAVGAEGNFISILTARHFAPHRYGQAYGALYALFLIGGAVGPAVLGFLFDATGSYRIPLLVGSAALVASAFAALRLVRLPPFEPSIASAPVVPHPEVSKAG